MNWPVRLPSGLVIEPITSRRSQASHVAKHMLAVRERWWQVPAAGLVQAEIRETARELKQEFDLCTGQKVDHKAELHPTLAALLRVYHDENYAPAYGAALSDPLASHAVPAPDPEHPGEAQLQVATAAGIVVVARGRGTQMSVRSAWRDPPGQTNRRTVEDFSRAGVRKARWLAFSMSETLEEVEP